MPAITRPPRRIPTDLGGDSALLCAGCRQAGFVLKAESSRLRNPADDHDNNVFDPSIRSKTDRFVYRFRKPAR